MSSKIEKNANNEDITTDAMPSSPRDNPNTKTENENSSDFKNKNSDSSSFTYKKPKPRGFPKYRLPPSACYFNICNSTNVQVGPCNYYNYSNENNKWTSPHSQIPETEIIQSMWSSQRPVTRKDIMLVSAHMGQGWRDSIRDLGYSDGQIDQFVETHHISGVKEVIYQLLRDWIEDKAELATVAILSKTLWNRNQRDAVYRWSLKLPISGTNNC